MKFKNLASFHKHLKESAPDNFSEMYALIMSDAYERTYYAKKMYALFSHFRPGLKIEWCSQVESSLFAEERLVVTDEIKVVHLDPKTRVIMLGSSIPQEVYETLKKEMVCLDLSDEKPWDRKTRYLEEMIKMAKGEGKRLDAETANFLLERMGMDFPALHNEVAKLCCYVGDGAVITSEHVKAISGKTKEATTWQIAESLVWQGHAEAEFKDLSELLALFSQIRFHLYAGVELSGQAAAGVTLSYKNLRKKELDRYGAFCQKVGVSYFLERLMTLFEMELMAKNYGADPAVLWDLLVIRFSSYDVASTSQFTKS